MYRKSKNYSKYYKRFTSDALKSNNQFIEQKVLGN